MKIFLKKLLVTGFYTGMIPVFPGTFGTIAGVIIYILLVPFPFILYPLILILLIYGVPLSTWAEKYFKEKDSQKIVIDEIVGFLITMSAIKINFPLYSFKFFLLILLGFGLFRFFDGLKPFYIREIEKLNGGLGIMLDDVLAGIYSALILNLIVIYIIR